MMVLACAIIIGATSATAQELATRKQGTVREQMEQSSLFQGNNTHFDEVRAILDYANSFIGTRYRSGSSSPKGFDCSGFTSYVFKNFGYQLTRSSSSQVSDGTPVAKNELQPGDLVFFNGRILLPGCPVPWYSSAGAGGYVPCDYQGRSHMEPGRLLY